MVDLERVDYRAREAVRWLNRFPGIETYEACSGHLDLETGDGLVYRFVVGLSRIGANYYLDGKAVAEEEAARLFAAGNQRGGAVVVVPLAALDQYLEPDAWQRLVARGGGCFRRHSYLTFRRFEIPWFGLSAWDRRKRDLAERLQMLYGCYRDLVGRDELESGGFFAGGEQAESAAAMARLVEHQRRIEQLWEDIAALAAMIHGGRGGTLFNC